MSAGSRMIARFLEENTANASGVVELGCGAQPYKNWVLCDYVGIDIRDFDGALHYDMRDVDAWVKHVDGCDTALFMDSLEHLSRDDALELLRRLKERFDRILVFVPTGDHLQDFGPDHPQTHRSIWNPGDLEALGFSEKFVPEFHEWDDPAKSRGAMFAVWRLDASR